MIVDLKYTDMAFLSSGVAYYLTVAGRSPRKILHALTILQFWLQFVLLAWWANDCLFQHGFTGATEYDGYVRCSRVDEFYYVVSLTFQVCDIGLATFASYRLRYAASLFSSNVHDVKSWLMVNDLYVLSSVTCLYFVFSSLPEPLVASVRAITTLVFACSKMFIVRRIHSDEKSSYVVLLEQDGPSSDDSPKAYDDFARPESHVVTIEAFNTDGQVNFGRLLYATNT